MENIFRQLVLAKQVAAGFMKFTQALCNAVSPQLHYPPAAGFCAGNDTLNIASGYQ